MRISPLNLVQEQQLGKPYECWRILVCCALLNRTHGRQVRPMLDELFAKYPSPAAMIGSTSAKTEHLVNLLRPLGLYNRRMKMLYQLSAAYLELWREREPRFGAVDASWAEGLPGCGPYAIDSLNIFVYGILENVSSDTWLNQYIDWRKNGQSE